MTELLRITIDSHGSGEHEKHELRLDWYNDRHQAIHLDGLKPVDIEAGLVRASIEINNERRRGEI